MNQSVDNKYIHKQSTINIHKENESSFVFNFSVKV